MKTLLLLSLLLPFCIFGQTDTVRLVKAYNYHPMIANTQTGDIEYWKLCDSAGMLSKEECTIISFEMSYLGKKGTRNVKIHGHNIPDSICTEIGIYGMNQMIFFTNIKAISHHNYKVLHLTAMNLVPIKRED